MSSKKSRKMEEPMEDYHHEKFVNLGACKKFTVILAKRSFIKEKGFHYPEDFFRKNYSKERVEGAFPTS